ncbi:MAG: SRPBCC family protein [Polyangiales bacterium]
MTIFATAQLDIDAPLATVFAHFIDFPRWGQWMPAIFTPIAGPERAFRAGDSFKVRIGKLPVPLSVVSFRQDAEFGWRGGSRLVIEGVHTFKFEALGGKTRIRSEETLSGLLALNLFAEKVRADASAQALVLMERFAIYLSRTYVPEPLSA